METSLHRQLKEIYASDKGDIEVPFGDYRIDVIVDGELIEIQHGSLAAIRGKIRKLVERERVRIVKPIIARKKLIKLNQKNGSILGQRMSPKRQTLMNAFDELVYFNHIFPHHNLTIEFVLVEIKEWRYPGHGKRRRRRDNDYLIQDQKLDCINARQSISTTADLLTLLPDFPASPFDTKDLADCLEVDRWVAQRIAYCLRKAGAIEEIGKRKNALLYALPEPSPPTESKGERPHLEISPTTCLETNSQEVTL